jgi:hypothetical protein
LIDVLVKCVEEIEGRGIMATSTSFVINNRKINKIIAGANLIVLFIFLFFLYITYRI